jgi:hypothetical protein
VVGLLIAWNPVLVALHTDNATQAQLEATDEVLPALSCHQMKMT